MPGTETLVVLPTYNERDNLAGLVAQLLDLPGELGVIVVDDNSPDGTGELADELARSHPHRLTVIHRPGKLGLGTAYLAGFDAALERSPEHVITMDADFSHHPRYIPSMVDLAAASCDLVIGSRYTPGGGALDHPLYRKLLSTGANAFARSMLRLRARDATAGFRCYRRQVLAALPLDEIKSSGYSFLIEMLFLVQYAGFRVGELPILFKDRRRGKSKISRDEIYKAIWTVARLKARRWSRFAGRASGGP